jgi:hypothetical protein
MRKFDNLGFQNQGVVDTIYWEETQFVPMSECALLAKLGITESVAFPGSGILSPNTASGTGGGGVDGFSSELKEGNAKASSAHAGRQCALNPPRPRATQTARTSLFRIYYLNKGYWLSDRGDPRIENRVIRVGYTAEMED